MALEYLTPDEDEVAKLLLHLKAVIFTRELKSKVVFEWGKTATRTNPRLKGRDNACVASQPTTAAPEANSPASPLSFSSEADSKVRSNQLHHRHRYHSKRKKLEDFTELTQQQLRLQLEIQKVTNYYQSLTNFNSLLREKKEELISAAATVIIKPDSEKREASSNDRAVLIRSSDGRLIELDLNVPPEEEYEYGDSDGEAFQPKISELEKERDRSKRKAREARLRRTLIKRYKTGKNKNPSPTN